MPEQDSKLSLDPDGNDFLLRKVAADGTATAIKLSDADILTLAQSALILRSHVLAKRSREGADAVMLTPAARIELNTDLHNSEIHLAMIDRHGASAWFSLSLELARLLRDGLPPRVSEIEKSRARLKH